MDEVDCLRSQDLPHPPGGPFAVVAGHLRGLLWLECVVPLMTGGRREDLDITAIPVQGSSVVPVLRDAV
jgi:hypothetical protein